jgi:hypothetical protein
MGKDSRCSSRTTNCIENVSALLGQHTDKVDYWRNSDQRRRCLAAALLDIRRRLRRVCACLVRLRAAMQTQLKGFLEQVA